MNTAKLNDSVLNYYSNYNIIYNSKYDFKGEYYNSLYPNLHKYPATMLPQIGLKLLKEFKAKKTNLLDPYCGSGSSFSSGLEYGIKKFVGFDLNPLAILISKAKLNYIEANILNIEKDKLKNRISKKTYNKNYEMLKSKIISNIKNIDFWIEKKTQEDLIFIYSLIENIKNKPKIKNIFLLSFSETLREASYTRNNEFKLFRMQNYQNYKPDAFSIFAQKLDLITENYLNIYQPKLKNINFNLYNSSFVSKNIMFDTILTSPPYGDSKTTVAYGQFSTFINEWLGFENARKLDSILMGGKKASNLYMKGLIKKYIMEIEKIDKKRALEVSSFYFDLEASIKSLLNSINTEGLCFFIVGNRRVKNIELPTDKFIAQLFKENNFKHITTIERKISNKAMPIKNSPTNKIGILSNTINKEYIIVCEKNY